MGWFNNINEEFEKKKDEIISTWNRRSVCGCNIPPCEDAQFNGKCEDCFFDSRK